MSAPLPPPASAGRSAGFGAGAVVLAHVVRALMLRETRTRFGRHRGGYLWAVAEPVAYIAGLLLLAGALGRAEVREAESAVHFAAGVLAFLLFRETVQRAVSALSANRGLLMHPPVTPLDLVLARALLEAATGLVVAVVVGLGILAIWGGGVPAAPLALLAALATASLLGLAAGLLLAAAATAWPVVERAVAPLMRIGFLISGAFFSPDALPPALRETLLWNPVLHVTEAARNAWLAMPPETHGTLLYPLAVTWALLPLGLAAERAARSRVAVA